MPDEATISDEVLAAAREAIRAAGGGAMLARAVNVSKSAVTHWLTNGIPAVRVPIVARLSGLSYHQVRPDLFPEDV
jgi:DNA-binding transcriptional regulator YdaS (Cro superfamily)